MFRIILLLTYTAMSGTGRAPFGDFHAVNAQNFCSPGAYGSTTFAIGQPRNLKYWGSFCEHGDQTTGFLETSVFKAPSRFGLYLAGYVSADGLSLEVENTATGSRIPIKPDAPARERWVKYNIRLPASWSGAPVRLIATDNATRVQGWFAFSEPLAPSAFVRVPGEAVSLLSLVLLHFLFIILPCFALGSLAIRAGIRNVVIAGLCELSAIGLIGYFSFWTWFASPKLGHLVSVLIPMVSAILLIWNWRALDKPDRRLLNQLLTPFALCGAASLLVLSLGFIYQGFATPLDTPGTRFSHPLAGDNRIPFEFAQALRNSRIPVLGAGWKSSDRPPLQTGLVLSQGAFLRSPRELSYAVLSTILQGLWIFSAWLLLKAFRVNTKAAALSLGVCLFSGFVFLNSFFVWPKLLAAAYMLGLFALLLSPERSRLGASWKLCVLAGSLLALGFLAHGGSAFALVGVAILMPILRYKLPVKRVALVLSTAFLLYTPWIAYQKLCDPPGDRLLKMHLAGVDNQDSRSFPAALIDAYAALSLRQIVANKIGNVRTLLTNSVDFWRQMVDLSRHRPDIDYYALIASYIRGWMFFFFVVNLGFLIVGPFFLISGLRRNGRTIEWRFSATIWLYLAASLFAWCLLMFKAPGAVIHQGTYVNPLLAYIGSILAVWTVSRVAALLLACFQIALNILLYVVFMGPATGTVLPATYPMHVGCFVLAMLSLLLTLWLLQRIALDAAPQDTSRAPRQIGSSAQLQPEGKPHDSIRS